MAGKPRVDNDPPLYGIAVKKPSSVVWWSTALTLVLYGRIASAQEPFEAVVKRAIADCAPSVALHAVDCTGAACMAIFDDPQLDWATLVGCPVWKEVYGQTVSTLGGHAECADGSLRPYFLMAPEAEGSEAMAAVGRVRDVYPCGPDDSERRRRRRGGR